MATLVTIYRHPADAVAFDAYYRSTLLPPAKAMPESMRCVIGRDAVGTPQGPSAHHQLAVLGFDSMDALVDGLSSAQGQATAADLANLAQAGVEVLLCDSEVVPP